MSLSTVIRKVRLLDRNRKWWRAPISTSEKLSYYAFIVLSFTKVAVTRKKSIRYLGKNLHFDNIASPFTLQVYPYEISHNILSSLSAEKIKNVLDIGGNIGQFSLTLNHVLKKKVRIDIFEPNPEAFTLLEKNVSDHNNIRAFNFGIGESGNKTFYYKPGHSGTGSIFRSNSEHIDSAKKIVVKLVDDISKITGRTSYDLMKIDVEGYEFSLLQALKPLKIKYLAVEISVNRYRDYRHSELFKLIEKRFGKFDIINSSPVNPDVNNFDTLLIFTR